MLCQHNTHTHTYVHTHTPAHKVTHTHTQTPPHTPTYSHTHQHTPAHTHTHTRAHTHPHTHPQTHTHTHPHTLRHAHIPALTKHMSCVCHKPLELSFNESELIFGQQALLLRHLRALFEPIQPLSELNSAPSSRASVQRCPRSAYMPACGSHQWVTRVCCETLGPWASSMFCLGRGVCAARTWALEFRTYLRLRDARRQDLANSCSS